MPVSREAVVWAYRLMLGREPENETVVAHAAENHHSVEHLRDNVAASEEFVRRNAMLVVGRHQHVQHIPVETSSSDADLRAMLENIAREWRRFGVTEPHWSVVTSEQFRPETIADNLDRFYAIGVDHLKSMLNPLKRSGLSADRFGKILDFGCGVGRLTLPLARIGDRVTGVDISPPHLELARARAREKGVGNVDFVAIDAVDDLDQFSGYDLIVSFIVLQHNPPPVMAAIFAKLLKALAPGGCAIIQMPTYIAGATFSVADYLSTQQPAMEMNAIPQHVIFEIAEAAGCRMLEVREDNFMGADIGVSHTFAMRKHAG